LFKREEGKDLNSAEKKIRIGKVEIVEVTKTVTILLIIKIGDWQFSREIISHAESADFMEAKGL